MWFSRNKLIAVRYYFIRELINDTDIVVNGVRSNLLHADILTKALGY